jgi:hypothetical protein
VSSGSNDSSTAVVLLLPCRPTAIFQRIPSVVIDSIKCELRALSISSRRRFTHVSQKVFELMPAFANLDSSSPIARKTRNVMVCATAHHVAPCLINRSMAFSMRDTSSSPFFFAKTPARARHSAQKTMCRNRSPDSALAGAYPKNTRHSFLIARNNSQPTESLTFERIEFHFAIRNTRQRAMKFKGDLQ